MKNKLLALLVLASTPAFAAQDLSYSCKVTKSNYNQGRGLDCGTVTLGMNDTDGHQLKNCGIKVYGGSAWGSKCRGIHIVLGTDAGVFSPDNLRDQTSIFFCPESAPESFQMSLLPRSPAVDISMDCSKVNL